MDSTAPSNDPRTLELQQLQREYRHMEINRRAYAEESQSILRTQQATIDKMRKDNDGIKNDISIIMRGSNRSLSTEQQETMQSLNEQGEKYLQIIEYEKTNIDTMTEQIQILRQKSLNQRKAMGGVNASRENYLMIQKQIRILENRLDKSLIKFNEAINLNKALRNQIDDLRRERIVFENIYRKMEKDLQDRKKAMAEIIETSNQSYEQRDNYQMEIAAIEQANRKEQEEFDEQMITLGRILDQELQLPTPGSSLGARSKSTTKVGSSVLSPGRGGTPSGTNGLNGGDSSLPAGSTLTGGGNTTLTGTGGMSEIDFRERAQNFEEAFNKIKAATGIQDIEELVDTFIKNEEHNFSLFNYVNEQNNEIEKLEETIAALREEESKYAQESGNDVNQHKEILKDLETKLHNTDAMAEKYELRCQDLSRIIESLKRGMQSIMNKLEWEPEELMAVSASNNNNGQGNGNGLLSPGGKAAVTSGAENVVLGVTNTDVSGSPTNPAAALSSPTGAVPVTAAAVPTISEVNMVNYLGILEKKAIQLLHHYTNLQTVLQQQQSSNNKTSVALDLLHGTPHDHHQDRPLTAASTQSLVSVLGAGPKIPMGQDHLHVNPPKSDDYRSDDDEDEDDDDTRPLTRDELKSRTLNRLQKRIASLSMSALGNTNGAGDGNNNGNNGNDNNNNNAISGNVNAGMMANNMINVNTGTNPSPASGMTKRSFMKK